MCRLCAPSPLLSRRAVLRLGAGAGAALGMAACDRLPIQLVSDETVERMGLETWRTLRTQIAASRNDRARQAVAGVAERLLVASGQDPSTWEVEIFAKPDVNAFVLPGRKIGVFEGMLRVARSPGEIAAVIGHEIGHLKADHPKERLSVETAREWTERVVSFALESQNVTFAREIAAALGVGVEFGLLRPYSRRQELEADRVGLEIMAKAGFDPRDAVRLWERMEAAGGGSGPAILSTHPAPRARIEALEGLIPQVTASRG